MTFVALHRAVAVLILACASAAAVAAEAGAELRLGLLAHDVGVFGGSKEDGGDANVELLVASPAALSFLGGPRPHLGVTASLIGETSFLYGGLTWSFEPTRRLFVEASLGAAIHNGSVGVETPERKALGCRALFRESVSLGWRLTPRFSLSLMLGHFSNALLCNANEGLDNAGLRLGYRF